MSNTSTFVELGSQMYRLRYILSLREFNEIFFGEPKKYKLFGYTIWTSRKDWKYHLKKAIVLDRMEDYYLEYHESTREDT